MALTIPDKGEGSNDIQSVLCQSDIDAVVGGFNRTGVLLGCGVSQRAAGANMSVDVAAGVVMVGGLHAIVAATNVAVSAADATNPRLDLVVANGSGVISVLTGVAAGAPIEPTLDPTTYAVLAQLYVPATATTVTTARIIDRRISFGNGVIHGQPGFKSGYWYGAMRSPSGGTAANGNGLATYTPFVVSAALTADRIGVIVTTAGSTGALLRLGIYLSDASGAPGKVYLDAGTVDATTTGLKAITISKVLPPGLYWLACVCQGAPTTAPTVRLCQPLYPQADDSGTTAVNNQAPSGFYTVSGVTGAFADSPTLSGIGSGGVANIQLRAA
jgi:hypothetical protein